MLLLAGHLVRLSWQPTIGHHDRILFRESPAEKVEVWLTSPTARWYAEHGSFSVTDLGPASQRRQSRLQAV